MSTLPLLVEWGHVISKIVVGGLAGLALLGYRSLRNRADVKPALEDAQRMGLSIDEPREGPIAVRGTYRREDGEQWLECSGQRVALASDISIVRGSSATWENGVRTYSLRNGDTVIAIGKMGHRASAETAGYRDAAGGWELAPSAGEPVIQVCVAKPVPCPRPLWPIRGVLALVLAGVVAYFGLGALGKKLVAYRKYPREMFLTGDGVSTVASQIACALPRSRESALTRYEIDLEYQPRTNDNIDKRIAVARMRNCQSAVDLSIKFGRLEQAVTDARACNHPGYAREALVLLGKYDEAAQIATTASPDLFSESEPLVGLVGAGRWREAAVRVETRDFKRDGDNERCLARYLKSLAGDPVEAAGDGKVCRIVDGVFDSEEDKHDSHVSIARWVARNETDGFFDPDDIAKWFAAHVTADDEMTHALRAQRAMDLGDFALAATEVEKAVTVRIPAADPDRQQYQLRRHRDLANELALRNGQPIEPFEPPPADDRSVLEAAAALRAGATPGDVMSLQWKHFDELVPMMDAAARGDGRSLARAFETSTAFGGVDIYTEYLLAVAPKITSHRDELALAIRAHRFGSFTITSTVHAIALHRDVLRLLGDKAGADRLQSMIDRHATVFADPKKLMALLLMQVR